MGFGNGFDKAEPKPQSAPTAALISAVKTIPYPALFRRRNARSFVSHHQVYLVQVSQFSCSYGDFRILRAVLERIVHQICHQPLQSTPVTSDHDFLRRVKGKHHTTFFSDEFVEIGNGFNLERKMGHGY